MSGLVRAELEAELRYSLDQRIKKIIEESKHTLEINREGRKVPHYPFIPSLCNPDPWGEPSSRQQMVHKKSGKKRDSRRKGK